MTGSGPAVSGGRGMRQGRGVGLTGIALVAALALSACGNDAGENGLQNEAPQPAAASSSPGTKDGSPVTIASGVSDQTRVIAYMYAQQLQAQGIAAEVINAGDERAGLIDALQSRKVDVVPDFTGDLYLHVAQNETAATPSPTPSPSPSASEDPGLIGSLAQLLGVSGETGPSGDDVYNALPDAMPKDVTILNESPGENTDRFVVSPATAAELELDDLTSVGKHCSKMSVGMPGNYADTAQGVKGLKSYYNCTPKSAPEITDYSDRVDELLDNKVQAAVLPQSSPVIEDDDLTVLDDPKNLYRPEKVVAVASDGLTGDAVSAINGITTGIRTGDLTMMTRLVSGPKPDMTPEQAATFVREQPR